MKQSPQFVRHATAVAVAFALLQLPAFAQDAAPAAAAPAPAAPAKAAASDDVLNMDAIVVTGTSEGISKMNSSVSISTLDADQILDVQPTNITDVLRSIPGVHAEASSGSSNANITVRGVPLSAGGARYINWQEDGLPMLQIGDLDFFTPDTLMRIDNVTDHVEVVRGGSASTLATNAPGGIINFISKTGEVEENSIGITEGVNFNESRFDFGKGGAFGARTTYYIGGFYRLGEGVRQTDEQVERGGQIRLSVTQKLDNGYVRLSLKELDDHTPTNLPVPVLVSGSTINQAPGIDPRTASFYSSNLLPDSALNSNNTTTTSNVNSGMYVHSSAIGGEAGLDLGQGFKLDEHFRYAQNSGHFLGVYGGAPSAAPAGTTFATGPNAGAAYSGNAFEAVVFNTDINDASLTANDLKLSKHFSLGGADDIVATAGLYNSSQRVEMTWNFNQYLLQATGKNAAVLSSATNGTPGFGGCCMRYINANYDMTSPYLNLTSAFGPVNLDASIRRDEQRATGFFAAPYEATQNGPFLYHLGSLTTPSTAYSGGGSLGGATPSGTIDYSLQHTSYSVGGNWRIVSPVSVFVRYSDGVAFNGDRLAWGQGPTDGGPVPINEIKQLEGGVKLRAGGASLFATLFQARTKESNYDLTTQLATANTYLANGVELEAGYVLGDFHFTGGLTLTDAKITSALNPAIIGTAPDRLAHTLYQFATTYDGGPLHAGINLAGTSSSANNGATLPSYVTVNLFARYAIVPSTNVFIGVNNLFNALAYTEYDGGGQARALDGVSVKAGISYSFH